MQSIDGRDRNEPLTLAVQYQRETEETAAMIDWNRLQGLRTDIGEEDFADIAMIFVAEITEHLERLVQDPNTATASDFHFLRGSAANMGFIAMVEACRRAETTCLAGEVPDVAGIAESFTASLRAVAADIPGIADAA